MADKMFDLAKQGNHIVLKEILKNDPYSYSSAYSRIAFLGACEGGCIDIIEGIIQIMKNHKDIMSYNEFTIKKYRDSGLFYACKGGHQVIIDKIIKLGSKNWDYALSGACEGGHMNLIEVMIKKFIKYCKNNEIKVKFDEAFIYAIEGKHGNAFDKILPLVIEYNNAPDWEKFLCIACEIDNNYAVEKIVEKCEKDEIYVNWYNALLCACLGTHKYSVDKMFDMCIKYNFEIDCNTVLSTSCEPEKHGSGNLYAVKKMIEFGTSERNPKEINWNNTLHLACNQENLDIVKTILDHMPNITENEIIQAMRAKRCMLCPRNCTHYDSHQYIIIDYLVKRFSLCYSAWLIPELCKQIK